jgi:cytidine deaminase
MKHHLTLSYESSLVGALPEVEQLLLQTARQASDLAYAPYSRFLVGAALLLESGQIVTGSNKENASFPAGICAERNAINYASDHFTNDQIKTLAVSARSEEFEIRSVLSPCGICRQVMTETELVQNNPIRVILDGPNDEVWIFERAADLLPFHFYLKELKK